MLEGEDLLIKFSTLKSACRLKNHSSEFNIRHVRLHIIDNSCYDHNIMFLPWSEMVKR